LQGADRQKGTTAPLALIAVKALGRAIASPSRGGSGSELIIGAGGTVGLIGMGHGPSWDLQGSTC
jgi:hypothetical protein